MEHSASTNKNIVWDNIQSFNHTFPFLILQAADIKTKILVVIDEVNIAVIIVQGNDASVMATALCRTPKVSVET